MSSRSSCGRRRISTQPASEESGVAIWWADSRAIAAQIRSRSVRVLCLTIHHAATRIPASAVTCSQGIQRRRRTVGESP
jgi:hypothetical protein